MAKSIRALGKGIKVNGREQGIAKALGITPAGLTALSLAAAGKPHGGSVGGYLERHGWLDPDIRRPTASGMSLVARARQMGW